MLETLDIRSEILKATHRSRVLAPKGTGAQAPASSRLPVLYLFRGLGQEWFDTQPERKGRNLATLVADLEAEGEMEPLVIVCPDGMARREGGEVAHCAFDLADSSVVEGTGRFRRYFVEEFFPRVEDRLFGGKGPLARAIGGFSLGSLSAFALAMYRPELFRVVSSYDGAFLYWGHDHPEGTGPPENDLRLDLFPYWFGNPPRHELFRRYDPGALLASAAGAKLEQLRRLTFYQHASAERHATANAWREERMARAVEEAGCSQGFDERLLSPDARHDWYWVDEHLLRLLPALSRALRSEEEAAVEA